MDVFTHATREKRAPGYGCVKTYGQEGVDHGCQFLISAPVDAAVTELFLSAVTPAQIDSALPGSDQVEAERAEARRQRQMQLQQVEHEVQLARRRYGQADSANRLVAAELEALG
jgi:hypothetical protein